MIVQQKLNSTYRTWSAFRNSAGSLHGTAAWVRLMAGCSGRLLYDQWRVTNERAKRLR
jgi:hypothetical protein